ncbi:hypothetical protein QJS66_01825 [Kocuria rhizophila]|nr:hypothetical protein QJS66_01825 [Kocuria rhizophila]
MQSVAGTSAAMQGVHHEEHRCGHEHCHHQEHGGGHGHGRHPEQRAAGARFGHGGHRTPRMPRHRTGPRRPVRRREAAPAGTGAASPGPRAVRASPHRTLPRSRARPERLRARCSVHGQGFCHGRPGVWAAPRTPAAYGRHPHGAAWPRGSARWPCHSAPGSRSLRGLASRVSEFFVAWRAGGLVGRGCRWLVAGGSAPALGRPGRRLGVGA